jgi:hypothetical protein
VGDAARRLSIQIGYASLDSAEPESEAMLESARRNLRTVYSGAEEPAVA